MMQRRTIAIAILAALFMFGWFVYALGAPGGDPASTTTVFEIQKGDGFRRIVSALAAEHLIRSPFAFTIFAVVDGKAFVMHPGLYRLDRAMSASEVLGTIAGGNGHEATVTIPEGSNTYDIDRILSNALVIRSGALVALNAAATSSFEGHLFPDTYNFFTDASATQVMAELEANFGIKAAPLLAKDPLNARKDLVIASLVEKEVPDPADQAIVAGIIMKRLASGMPLNIDATICYAKFQQDPELAAAGKGCYPLTPFDFKLDSPYNTYLYKGLPPGPIGNPGVGAITAALNPKSSPYWYYLSDPKTGKTIFAKTLDEQNQNRAKYLVR